MLCVWHRISLNLKTLNPPLETGISFFTHLFIFLPPPFISAWILKLQFGSSSNKPRFRFSQMVINYRLKIMRKLVGDRERGLSDTSFLPSHNSSWRPLSQYCCQEIAPGLFIFPLGIRKLYRSSREVSILQVIRSLYLKIIVGK